MGKDPIKVVVVTPVFNRREETLQCLRSLGRSKLSNVEIHIIIVDDGSTDHTSQFVKEAFPNVEILFGNGDLWYTGGTNRGLEKALGHRPKYILAINNDTIFEENCIDRMVACAEAHPLSVVGAVLLEWDTPHKVFQVAPQWDILSGGYRHWRHQTVWTIPDRTFEVELIVGNCVLYPADAVRQCGLMNEKKFPQFGDAEYTPRMRRHGWKLLIEPRAHVFCKPNEVVAGFRKLPYQQQFRELFIKATGPYSIKRRFNATVYGGPSKIQGLIAFFIFFIRKVAGINIEGSWGISIAEKPLSETYSNAVIRN
jgi:GT2 family glycosyltransferase